MKTESWQVHSKPESVQLSPDRLIVLPIVAERPASLVADAHLRNSIAKGGIQQDLIAVRDGERILLVKGMRRLRIARLLDLKRVPVLVYDAPEGADVEAYIRELRFELFKRQDLLPSQKGELCRDLKARFGMTNNQVAAFLGIAPDSVTNWMAVLNYLPPIVAAMDAGNLTMQAARVFDGMTPEGQKTVWKVHGKEMMQSGASAHKRLRAEYPPASFPDFYRDPKLITRRLRMKGGKRTARSMSAAEKQRLADSHELRAIAVREGEAEHRTYKRQNEAAIPLVNAVHRNEELLAYVTEKYPEMIPDFQRFSEALC